MTFLSNALLSQRELFLLLFFFATLHIVSCCLRHRCFIMCAAFFFFSILAYFVVTNVFFSMFVFCNFFLFRWRARAFCAGWRGAFFVFFCCSSCFRHCTLLLAFQERRASVIGVVVGKIGMSVLVDVWRMRTKRIGYFTFPSGRSIPSCIPSISTSLVLLVFWFVKILVVSDGCRALALLYFF